MRVPGIEVDERRGKRIKAARGRRGLSQREAAELIGVSKRTVWSWEQGEVIHRPNLVAVAEALQTDLDWLRYGEPADDDTEASANGAEPEPRRTIDQRLAAIEEQLESLVESVEELLLREPALGQEDQQPDEVDEPPGQSGRASGSTSGVLRPTPPARSRRG